MFNKVTTLTEFVLEEEKSFPKATGSFTLLITLIENAAKIIASHVKKTGLVDILGMTGEKNAFNEEVQKLDEFSNDTLINILRQSGQVRGIASEELKEPIILENNKAHYDVFFDPLDGSSNIDVNINIGTIFSVYKRNNGLLQKGAEQVAAGYIIYGPSVMFIYSCGNGVNGFTLDPSIGSFLLSNKDIKIPEKGNIYSINEGNYFNLDAPHRKYIDSIKKEGKNKLRYVGSLVADVHRTLLKGGIFLYPGDSKNPDGKLRLMYEVNPVSYLVTQAGGKAVCNRIDPLEIIPASAHQKVPIVLGSTHDVDRYLNATEI